MFMGSKPQSQWEKCNDSGCIQEWKLEGSALFPIATLIIAHHQIESNDKLEENFQNWPRKGKAFIQTPHANLSITLSALFSRLSMTRAVPFLFTRARASEFYKCNEHLLSEVGVIWPLDKTYRWGQTWRDLTELLCFELFPSFLY